MIKNGRGANKESCRIGLGYLHLGIAKTL